jgi:hypothetical protein
MIGLVESLIKLPLVKKDSSGIKDIYEIVVKEFLKIENEIGSHFYCLYIFKQIVFVIANVRDMYLKSTTRAQAVSIFKTEILKLLDYFDIKDLKLNYEKLICATILLSDKMQGIMYEYMQKLQTLKSQQYDLIPAENVFEILDIIDTNLPSPAILDDKTVVKVWDNTRQVSSEFTLPASYIQKFNNKIVKIDHQITNDLIQLYEQNIN